MNPGKGDGLLERTALFGESAVTFARKAPKNVVTAPIIRHLAFSI